MVSSDEISRKLDMKRNGVNSLKEMEMMIEDNTSEDYGEGEESILGQITTNTVNRYFQMSWAKHDYYTLFFTNKRLMIVETNQYSNLDSLTDFGFNKTIAKGKEALKIAEKLGKLDPKEIFNSDKPCLSIPYSKVGGMNIKKAKYLWKSPLSGGLITIHTPDQVIKYPLNPIKGGVFVWDLVKPDLSFLEDLKLILGDRLTVR